MEQRDRLRVAEVLHEDVQQALAACRRRIGMAGEGAGPATTRELRAATNLLLEAIETCRRLSSDVSPAIVQDHGLAAGLEWLAEHMETRHALVVKLDLEPGVQCADTIGTPASASAPSPRASRSWAAAARSAARPGGART